MIRGVALAGAAVALAAFLGHGGTDLRGRALPPHRGGTEAAAPAAHAEPTDQVDVSRTADTQAEVAVVASPTDPNVLLAGSNSFSSRNLVYSSLDGGATWTSTKLPVPKGLCSFGDPALAIDASGRQYYAFLAGRCFQDDSLRIALALATRASATGVWSAQAIAPAGSTRFNDKVAMAVDSSATSAHPGRLYLTWARAVGRSAQFEVVLAHSDNGGSTWSRAVKISRGRGVDETYPSVSLGADGIVYVAWLTLDQHVFVDRSIDGGDHFGRDVLVDVAVQLPSGDCHFGGTAVPAQPRRCVATAPLVVADPTTGHVYVSYGAAGPSGREQNVFVSSFDGTTLASLVQRRQVNPPDGKLPSDQFFPASAVDPASGRLWVCWYDTTGDRTRKRTRYSCATSSDGGATFTAPLRAATVYSNMTLPNASAFEYGDYAGLAVANGIAHPMWTDTRNLATLAEEIYTTAIDGAALQPP